MMEFFDGWQILIDLMVSWLVNRVEYDPFTKMSLQFCSKAFSFQRSGETLFNYIHTLDVAKNWYPYNCIPNARACLSLFN